jgi:hypothetical protein
MDRWTNSTVERFIGTRKKAGKNLEPAEYIVKNQKSALANCKEYISLQEQDKAPKTPKKQLPKTPSKTPSKTPKKLQKKSLLIPKTNNQKPKPFQSGDKKNRYRYT